MNPLLTLPIEDVIVRRSNRLNPNLSLTLPVTISSIEQLLSYYLVILVSFCFISHDIGHQGIVGDSFCFILCLCFCLFVVCLL